MIRGANDRIGLGIVGCGRAARQHLEAIGIACQGGDPRAEVVAVVDPDEGSAAALSALSGAAIRSFEELLQSPDVDAVCICTPPGSHAEMALSALGAGKAILVEKPVVDTLAKLDSMIGAAAAGQVPAFAMLQHRSRLPEAALAAVWSEDACASVQVIRSRSSAHYLADPWRCDPGAAAGGHVSHLGVHYLDMACQLLGMPATVSGLVECRDAGGIDTRSALAVRFAGGALMTILSSAHPAPRSERMHILDGERELLVTDETTRFRGEDVQELTAPRTPELRAAVYREFLAAIRREAPSPLHALERARAVTMLIEAVRQLASESASPR